MPQGESATTSRQPDAAPIGVARLVDALQTTEANLHVVPSQRLRRLLKKHRRFGGFGRRVPHDWGIVLPFQTLKSIVPDSELPAAPALSGSLLFILSRSRIEELAELRADQALLAGWRALFRLRVEARVNYHSPPEPVELADLLRHIGLIEVDEIRDVLRREHELLPPAPGESAQLATWTVFSGRYLELVHFEPDAIRYVFPGIAENQSELTQQISRGLPLAEMLQQSRPSGCPEAQSIAGKENLEPATESTFEDPQLAEKLRQRSANELERGNAVRAAMLERRATAHSGVTTSAPGEALIELGRRLTRLGSAAGEIEVSAKQWASALAPLLDQSYKRVFSPANRLLYDLQKACVDFERPAARVDLGEWLLSFGRRPIRRPLEQRRQVAILRHLRKAQSRLALLQLGSEQRRAIDACLGPLVEERERELRSRLAPLLAQALAGARPASGALVDKLAAEKLVDELVDRVIEKGAFNFPALRDAISRNQAKLQDLSGVRELISGDPLLRLDRTISPELEGVYRRGEIYRRLLQKFSSLFFGTAVGRLATLYFVLPFLGAYVALEGLQHTVGLALEKLAAVQLKMVSVPAVLLVGLFLLAVINIPAARRVSVLLSRGAWRALRFILWDIWVALFSYPPLRRLLTRVGRFVLDTLLGREFQEAFSDWLARVRRFVGTHLIPGLIRWVLAVFRAAVDSMERLLYRVDEWLRFRPGDRPWSIALKAAFGLPWSMVTYILRLYVNVLIEPKYNPVKHFPVVTVGHKIILPLSLVLTEALSQPLAFLGPTTATAVAATTVFLSPGLFGFLAWELKENWRLYSNNRSTLLKPVVVGTHGETMRRYLRPGFHSGAIPKLFQKLRAAARKRSPAERNRSLARLHQELQHIELSLKRFIERELLRLLRQSAGIDLHCRRVALASNRVRFELDREDKSSIDVRIEQQSGWLLADIADRQLLDSLSQPQRTRLEFALAGLFQLAGVQLDRRSVRAALPAGSGYTITPEELVAWPDSASTLRWHYPLSGADPMVEARISGTPGDVPPPSLARSALLLSEQPVPRRLWDDRWNTIVLDKPSIE